MEVDPMEAVETDDEEEEEQPEPSATSEKPASPPKRDSKRGRLNTWVAITVALLATFMGICKVKDDNICQAMQQAQADKIDNYAWYQARNVREEIGRTAAAQLRAQKAAAPQTAWAEFDKQIAACEKLTTEQATKKKEQEDAADKADKDYESYNFHDDQFDLSDALLALAISLLAVTALTQKQWLYGIAMVPTFFGVFYGLAGLFGLAGSLFHPDALTRLLGT